jgi:hypothetical protein
MKQSILPVLFFAAVLVAHSDDATGPENDSKVAAANPQLRRELLVRMNADQDARKAAVSWCQEHKITLDVDKNSLNVKEKAEYEKLFSAVQKIDGEICNGLSKLSKS